MVTHKLGHKDLQPGGFLAEANKRKQSTCGYVICLRKQPQEKQTAKLQVTINTCMVNV